MRVEKDGVEIENGNILNVIAPEAEGERVHVYLGAREFGELTILASPGRAGEVIVHQNGEQATFPGGYESDVTFRFVGGLFQFPMSALACYVTYQQGVNAQLGDALECLRVDIEALRQTLQNHLNSEV